MTEADDIRNAENRAGEYVKYSAVVAIVMIACYFLRKKLISSGITWNGFLEALQNVPLSHILLALGLTVLNYLVLTGYDWIAVRHLKKTLSMRKIMIGAIAGYSLSNVFGWIFGGTSVRYRLYSNWGFSLVEIIAFISILSLTFWLGMFLLAGVAFVCLPVHLPEDYRAALVIDPHIWGWLFLGAVAVYLAASLLVRKPVKWGEHSFTLPPFRLSLMQLAVSASDFAIASAVLYVLLPPGHVNFSTVLVSYLAAMIVTVTLHVPGGYGVLEVIVLHTLTESAAMSHSQQQSLATAVTAALVLYRVIYYFLPAIFAGGLLLYHESGRKHAKKSSQDTNMGATG